MQPKPQHKLLLHKGKLLKVQPRLQQQTNKPKQFLHKLLQRLMQPKPLSKLLLHKGKLLKVHPRLQQRTHKRKQLRCKQA